jgi:hypothetical protein
MSWSLDVTNEHSLSLQENSKIGKKVITGGLGLRNYGAALCVAKVFGVSKSVFSKHITGSTIHTTMVPVSTVQPSLNEVVGLHIFFHHSDILSCITFYIK